MDGVPGSPGIFNRLFSFNPTEDGSPGFALPWTAPSLLRFLKPDTWMLPIQQRQNTEPPMPALTSRSSLKPMAALAMMAFMLLVFLFGSAGPRVLAQGTTLPAAPDNLQAAPNSRLVTLTWDDPGDTTITGYKYRQSDRDGSTGQIGPTYPAAWPRPPASFWKR